MSEPVEYRDVPGYPGYRVGNDGSVWSCRVAGIGFRDGVPQKWRRLKPVIYQTGYLVVNLGRGNPIYVHRIVLLSFRGDPLPGHECCHNDGNRSNNRLGNLRWDTRKGNMADMKIHGTARRSVEKLKRKLKRHQAQAIRASHNDGADVDCLAEMYKVSRGAINNIVRRKTWASA